MNWMAVTDLDQSNTKVIGIDAKILRSSTLRLYLSKKIVHQ